MHIPEIKAPKSLTGLFTILFFAFTACNSSASKAAEEISAGTTKGTSVTINGTFQNCTSDSVFIYEIEGLALEKLAGAPVAKSGSTANFELKLNVPADGIYLIGISQQQATGILLGPEKQLTVEADCRQLAQTVQFPGSDLHAAFRELMQRATSYQRESNSLIQQLQQARSANLSQVTQLETQLKKVSEPHFAYLDSVVGEGGLVGEIAKMYNFKPYVGTALTTAYADEQSYFEAEFLGGLSLDDETLGYLPQLFEKARFYGQFLPQAGNSAEDAEKKLKAILSQAKTGSKTHKMLMLGFVSGLQQANNKAFMSLGKQFIETYPEEKSINSSLQSGIDNYAQVLAQQEKLAVGAEAPEITQQTPEGADFSLTSLRGKYVLIDFWASWCKPCRMENPNVVRMYKAYQGKGFEILGVSLDNQKQRWLAAIEQDGLAWKHVSDLRGWQNAAAATYNVRSIPATYLIGPEGNIIAKNLRGPSLEAKLKEIFE